MSLFTELKRRNVFRMAVLYLGAAWLLLQVADLLIDQAILPGSLARPLFIVLTIGFPIALLLAWFYEVTPEGILPEKAAASNHDAVPSTGRAMDFVVIAVLAAAVLLFAYDKWWLREAAAPVGYTNSVAVLAFDDLSPDGDQGWFSDGLSEEIINSLAQLPELKVTARTSAFHFKDLDLSIPEIAATLGVAHVVEGSVRRAGDRMRVTAQLIKADDGFHLWSETYDRSTDDVFAVQEDIAANIASALDIYLDEERREKMFQTGTRNVQAYEAYLRGLQLYNEYHLTYTGDSIWEAQRWFERALDYDPRFAAAHFHHSDAYFHYINGNSELPPDADTGLTPEVALDLFFRDFDRAIEFAHNEELRVFYQAERTVYSDDWSGFRALLEKLRTIREISTNPIFARFNQSDTAFALLGRAGIESNYRHFQKVLEVNPMFPPVLETSAQLAMQVGKQDEALGLIEQAQRIDSSGAAYDQIRLMLQAGRYDALLENPDLPPGDRALCLVLTGRHDEARGLIEELLADSKDNRGELNLALAQRLLGETQYAEAYFRAHDAQRFDSSWYPTFLVFYWGGRLIWDLEWTPNYAARLAEMGVELEQYEFPPPAE